MSLVHTIEVFAYSLLNFLPYFGMAFYPFLHKQRFKKPVTAAAVFLTTLLQSFFYIWTDSYADHAGSVLSLIILAVFLLFYVTLIKEDIRKLLFILLMVINSAYLIMVTAKCLEGFLFPALAHQDKRWSFVLCIGVAQAAFLPWYFVFLKKIFMPAAAVPAGNTVWNTIWLVPAVFYLIWYHDLYFSHAPEIERMLNPLNALFIILINAGAVMIYTIVLHILIESQRNAVLRAQNHMLAMQNLQYENMKERIDDARRARHDLKHHMRTMYTMAEQGEWEDLTAYLRDYIRTQPADTPLVFCQNMAMNAVVSFYAQTAEEHGIAFDARIDLPETLPVADADLTVLFGNLLENACDACLAMEPGQPRSIRLRVSMANDSAVVFTADNTFSGELKKDGDTYVSTKPNGSGLGLASMRAITARYNGTLTCRGEGGVFQVSGVLNT